MFSCNFLVRGMFPCLLSELHLFNMDELLNSLEKVDFELWFAIIGLTSAQM